MISKKCSRCANGTVQVVVVHDYVGELPWLDLVEVQLLAGDVAALVSLADTFGRAVLRLAAP